ncbi:flagellar filament capping protein FliD [Edwardsiella ictaluri]|uniref:flagellar filament capping protein FliD n=1 Tax=Edwardsiella ictaluri TaxID=67780 RepID=UPI0009C0DEDD|nr:flagellar filament capping protein FliD [Edwardsiella ictaluri]ARD38697.1 flagellar filament capping protein FliD [Edwardsiella ictaluri]QPW27117.1 flagellar filament capping protein FliD [Edwardsiella ictaluri]
MATISSLGIGSGLDLNSLLTKMTKLEQQQLTPYKNQQVSYQSKLTAYGTLKGALEKFDDVSKDLAKLDTFTITKASTHDQFNVTTTSNAIPGNYSISISQLAQAQSLTAQTHADSQTSAQGTPGASSRELTISVGTPPKETRIALADDQTSLRGMRDAINKSGANVKASIIQISDKEYTLSITANKTGKSSNIKLNVSGDSKLAGMLNYNGTEPANKTGMKGTVQRQDAELTLNGIPITRSSNQITDVPQGVTLELKTTTPKGSPQNLVISSDGDGVSKKIHEWADSYNSLIDTFQALTKFTPVKQGQAPAFNNGPLLGDSTLRAIQSSIKGALSSEQNNRNIKGIGNLGINTDPLTGKLSIDDKKLKHVIDEYPGQVQNLFIGNGKDTGIANMVHKEIRDYVKSNGVLDSTTRSINNSLQSLSNQIDSINQNIDATISRYKAQFVHLDTLMSKLNGTSSYLTQQFSAMNKSSDK